MDFNLFMINASKTVQQSGVPNYRGCQIELPSGFNLNYLEKQLKGYHDRNIINLLKYGFPIGHDGGKGSSKVPKNHTGVTKFPKQMVSALQKEIDSRAVLGPFTDPPFEKSFYSPLNSVEKKGIKARRLILDLSMPFRNAINESIDKDQYLGEWDQLTLPSIDSLTDRIAKLGKKKCSKLI